MWLCEQLLVDKNNDKAPLDAITPILGSDNMVLSNGKPWEAQRTAFNPGFKTDYQRKLMPIFTKMTQRMKVTLRAAAEQQQTVKGNNIFLTLLMS
jgi:cytochrome P450